MHGSMICQPLGAQFDRAGNTRIPPGPHSSPDAIPRLDHADRTAGFDQSRRGGEPRQSGTNDDGFHKGENNVYPDAVRTGRGKSLKPPLPLLPSALETRETS